MQSLIKTCLKIVGVPGRPEDPGGSSSAHTDPSLFCISKRRRVQPHLLASIQSGVLPVIGYNGRLPLS